MTGNEIDLENSTHCRSHLQTESTKPEPLSLWLELINYCWMQNCHPAEGCRQCLAADTAPIFSKNNVEAFVFAINTCISQNLSHWDRSKPRVVEADLRLLEMQITCAGAAQGSVETS